MKPLRLSLLGTAALLAALGNAEARGWYFSLEGGGNLADDVTADFRVTDAGATTFASAPEASFDSGWAVLATTGYAFTNNWRLEAELGYRQNETTSGTAQLDEWSLMVNALYDINLNGFGIGTFEFESQAESQSYTLTASARLSMLLGAFTWNGETRSFGLLVNQAPKPASLRNTLTAASEASSLPRASWRPRAIARAWPDN